MTEHTLGSLLVLIANLVDARTEEAHGATFGNPKPADEAKLAVIRALTEVTTDLIRVKNSDDHNFARWQGAQANYERQLQITIEADALATERYNEIAVLKPKLAAAEARERHTRQTLRTLLQGTALTLADAIEAENGRVLAEANEGVHAMVPTPSNTFRVWLRREMPQGTVIGDPDWWVPRIMRAVKEALNGSPT